MTTLTGIGHGPYKIRYPASRHPELDSERLFMFPTEKARDEFLASVAEACENAGGEPHQEGTDYVLEGPEVTR